MERFENVKIVNNSFLLIKVGNNERPASIQDIETAKEDFSKVIEKFPDIPITA